MKKYILFDLDGTLTDPKEGIINSIVYSLKKYGISVDNRTVLTNFIGPPLADSFKEYFGFDREKSLEAISFYREYFKAKGIFENFLYEKIEEMLYKLKYEGKTVILATSKPEEFALKILEHFNIIKYFDFVCGSLLDNTRTDKHDIIEFALNRLSVSDKSLAVMIGDRKHDIIGAKSSGMDSIGVTYGYGSYNELKNAGATYIAETVEELMALLDKI